MGGRAGDRRSARDERDESDMMDGLFEADENVTELQDLEKRIFRTIDQLKAAREEIAQLRQRLEQQDQQLQESAGKLKLLEKERGTVKTRVQKLMEKIDSLSQA